MGRRRRPRICRCGKPARRGIGTTMCAACFLKIGRPKVKCTACCKLVPWDTTVGKRCRPCISEAAHAVRVLKTYGLTPEMYDALLEFQGGRCYICHRVPRTKRLAVDHRHADGEVRGLLCKVCNRYVLGALGESVEALARAIEYLIDPPSRRCFGEYKGVPPGESD